MQSQLQAFLLAASFESDGMISHKHGLAAKYSSEWRPPQSLFFRIVGSLEAETSVSGKAECLLAIGEDKIVSSDFGVTRTFNLT